MGSVPLTRARTAGSRRLCGLVILYLSSSFSLVCTPTLAGGQTPDLSEKSQLAKQAISQGRFEEAAALYATLVKAVPGNAGLLMNLGMALHMAGEHRAAVARLRGALKLDARLTPAWLMLGLAHMKLAEPSKAVDPLQRVLKAEPNNRTALLEIADAFLSINQPEEAARNFERLAGLDPTSPKPWQGLGLSYVALSQRAFAQLEKSAPESAFRDALLARSRGTQQQYRSAFGLYRQALSKNPNLRGAHAAIAEVYRQMGHADWAATEQELERKIEPLDCSGTTLECDFQKARYREIVSRTATARDPAALYWRALALSELAKSAFSRLAELPKSAEVHELLARAYRIQGLHAEAIQQWNEALRFTPEDRRLQRELARTYWMNGDFQFARELFARLIVAERKAADVNYLLGDSLLHLQQAEEAVEYLENAVRLDPASLPACAALGRAYLFVNRPAEAVEQLKRALPIDRDGQIRFQLSRAYREAGNEALARRLLKQFEDLARITEEQRQKTVEQQQITPP